jgi:hypothetical protein
MENEKSNRQKAVELGLKTYIGATCKYGHINAERYTSASTCVICASQIAKSDKKREYGRKYYIDNAEAISKNKNDYYKDNREAILKARGEYYKNNREASAETHKKYVKENRPKINALSSTRHASKLQRTPPWVKTDKEHRSLILEKYSEAKRISAKTGILHHVDHIIPLQGRLVSGLHVWWNLQVIPATENLSKNNKFIDDYTNLTT